MDDVTKTSQIQESMETENEDSNKKCGLEGSCENNSDQELIMKASSNDALKNDVEGGTVVEVLSTSQDNFNLTVFVGKLNEDVTATDVNELFTKQIKLKKEEKVDVSMLCKVIKDSKKSTFAFVEFSNETSYHMALSLNNYVHNGENIIVLPAISTHVGLHLMDKIKKEINESHDDKIKDLELNNPPKPQPSIPVFKKSDHVAYLKHLPPEVTENDILKFFGFTREAVVDIAVLRYARARKSNPKRLEVRAVIAFASEETLEKCLAQTHKVFNNHIIEVERYGMLKKLNMDGKRSLNSSSDVKTSSSPRKQVCFATNESTSASVSSENMELDLFVKHINWNAPERLIKDFFGCVGAKVCGIKQFGDPHSKPRGMGFITMEDKDSLLKGLALDGTILFGNKIKVAVRHDRKHLEWPVKELSPNYSKFIGNLPMKINDESLKTGLTEHFTKSNCCVKSMYVPLADNHSGNRGYAFVTFQNEESLAKAMKFNNSELKLCSSKIIITVSNNWPENPAEIPDGIKAKEQDNKRVSVNTEPELPKSGRQHKRKRKVPISPHRGSTYKGPRDTPKKTNTQMSNTMDYTAKQQHVSNYDQYGSEYNAYLDYLEFRDYVAIRKAYDEQQVFADYHARQHAEREEEYVQKQKTVQSHFPSVSPVLLGTNVDRNFQESQSQHKVGNSENGWRNFISSEYAESGGFEKFPPGQIRSSTNGHEKFSQVPISASTYEKHSQAPLSVSMCGYEKYSSTPITNTTSAVWEKQDANHMGSNPSGRDANVFSNAPWRSGGMDRFNNNDTLQSESQWYSSYDQNCWERRDTCATYQDVNGKDSSSRGIKLSSCNSSGFPAERGNNVYSSRTPTPGTNRLSDLRSPSLHASKSERDFEFYSRLDRRGSPYTAEAIKTPLAPYPVAVDANSWYSSPYGTTVSSQNNEFHPYIDHSLPPTKHVEDQRNNVLYEKSGTFVSKLLSSGILSNAGYNVPATYHNN